MFARIRRFLFSISPDEATFSRRGFPASHPHFQTRFEQIGRNFIRGYLSALDEPTPNIVVQQLNEIVPEFQGFAYEGAAMGMAILDGVSIWRKHRLKSFIEGPASKHIYMAHVGAGWAFARLKFFYRSPETFLSSFDPLFRWLAVDGYGFHEGYFRWREFIEKHNRPVRLSPEALRVFDQGLGRALWFVVGGDVAEGARRIGTFPADRHADLWSGLGLACAYAGGCPRVDLNYLAVAAGDHVSHLRQGAAFAAKARIRAGNLISHTEDACQTICCLSAQQAAQITDEALETLAPSQGPNSYSLWRRRVSESLSEGRCPT